MTRRTRGLRFDGDRQLAHVVLAVLCVGVSACTQDYPSLDVSWTLRESNTADGEAARRDRTCAGALVDHVEVDVIAGEQFSMRFDCADGLFPRSVTIRDIYPIGHVDVALHFFDAHVDGDHAHTLETPSTRLIEPVLRDEIWVETTAESTEQAENPMASVMGVWTADPIDVDVRVRGTAQCETIQAELQYVDPRWQLHVGPRAIANGPSSGPMPETTIYRSDVRSNRGWRFDRTTQACSDLDGQHQLSDLDRGEYRLALVLDGERECQLEFEVAQDGELAVLDLEQVACRGRSRRP